MRIMILAVLAGLFGSIPFPASAHPDDRYFDSRAAAPVKAKVHKAVRHSAHHATRQRRIAPAVSKVKYRQVHWRANRAERTPVRVYAGDSAQVIGGRPAGCPSRFCGCGASLEVFGRIIPALNLAANWLRFPRTSPAPGMVAARRGHVFVLRAPLGNGVWMVHDSNSGGRMTRIHPRSLAGYAIVNPRGVGLFLR